MNFALLLLEVLLAVDFQLRSISLKNLTYAVYRIPKLPNSLELSSGSLISDAPKLQGKKKPYTKRIANEELCTVAHAIDRWMDRWIGRWPGAGKRGAKIVQNGRVRGFGTFSHEFPGRGSIPLSSGIA